MSTNIKCAVGRVDPIPTDPTPTESEVVITVPPVPTFSVVEVITPAVICPEEFEYQSYPTTVLKPVIQVIYSCNTSKLAFQRRHAWKFQKHQLHQLSD